MEHDAITKLSVYASSLGLRGIMIMSPACPDCGGRHDFQMLTDLCDRGSDLDAIEIRRILLRFADIAVMNEPVVELEFPGVMN